MPVSADYTVGGTGMTAVMTAWLPKASQPVSPLLLLLEEFLSAGLCCCARTVAPVPALTPTSVNITHH